MKRGRDGGLINKLLLRSARILGIFSNLRLSSFALSFLRQMTLSAQILKMHFPQGPRWSSPEHMVRV